MKVTYHFSHFLGTRIKASLKYSFNYRLQDPVYDMHYLELTAMELNNERRDAFIGEFTALLLQTIFGTWTPITN